MLEAVQADGGTLGAFPGAGDLEGRFDAAVERGAEFVPGVHDRDLRIDVQEIRNEWITAWNDRRFSQVSGLVIISGPEPRPRPHREPAEKRRRVGKLVEGIEPECAVVVVAGATREASAELGNARFAFVENRTTK